MNKDALLNLILCSYLAQFSSTIEYQGKRMAAIHHHKTTLFLRRSVGLIRIQQVKTGNIVTEICITKT